MICEDESDSDQDNATESLDDDSHLELMAPIPLQR